MQGKAYPVVGYASTPARRWTEEGNIHWVGNPTSEQDAQTCNGNEAS